MFSFVSSKAKRVAHFEKPLISNDKWVVVVSPGVIRHTPVGVIESIAQNSIHPAEFAQNLRNIAYTYNPNENISVVVADTQYLAM